MYFVIFMCANRIVFFGDVNHCFFDLCTWTQFCVCANYTEYLGIMTKKFIHLESGKSFINNIISQSSAWQLEHVFVSQNFQFKIHPPFYSQ